MQNILLNRSGVDPLTRGLEAKHALAPSLQFSELRALLRFQPFICKHGGKPSASFSNAAKCLVRWPVGSKLMTDFAGERQTFFCSLFFFLTQFCRVITSADGGGS